MVEVWAKASESGGKKDGQSAGEKSGRISRVCSPLINLDKWIRKKDKKEAKKKNDMT